MKPELDIDSLRTEHESDEQWAVRKAFMEEHKDKFSETELVTLAQLFTNIEFLGCRYTTTILGDMSYLQQNIRSVYELQKNLFGTETEHWTQKQMNGKKKKLRWLYSDFQCSSHRNCCWNKSVLKNFKKMQNKTIEDIVPIRIGKTVYKSSTVSAKQTNKTKNDVKEIETKHIKVKTVKLKPIAIETGKTVEKANTVSTKQTYKIKNYVKEIETKHTKVKPAKLNPMKTDKIINNQSSYVDYKTLNYKERNRSQYNNKIKNKQLLAEYNFIKHNELLKSKALNPREKPIRELHPFLTEFAEFVITKKNTQRFNNKELNIAKEHVADFLNDLDIPTDIVTFYGTLLYRTQVKFSVRDVNVVKFITHYEFDIDGVNYVISSYDKVKAAVLLPNEEKYSTKNPLKWLEILNSHIDVKPTEWDVIEKDIVAGNFAIYVTIPKKDAIALNYFNYRFNYFDVRVRMILFPKSKRNLEIYRKQKALYTGLANLNDSQISTKKSIHSDHTNNEETLTSSANRNVDSGMLSDITECQDKFNFDHENLEKCIFTLPFNKKFDDYPLVDIHNANKNKYLDFDQWELISISYFKDMLFVALPKVDAQKLERKPILKYNNTKIKVCFPDLEG